MRLLSHVECSSWLLVGTLAVAGAVAFPALSVGQPVDGSFDRTLTVSGAVDLSVTTGSGSITIRTGPAGSVRVVGRIRAGEPWISFGRASAEEKVKYLESHPPIAQSGNVVRVGRIDDADMRENVSISFEITAPAQCTLSSHSGSGSQRIENLSGPVEARSGSGSIELGMIGGRVTASAGSGTIVAGAVGGEFSARTGSGSVRVTEARGAVSISTGSGDVELTQSAQAEVQVSASSGHIELRGVQGPLRAESSSGGISVQGTPADEWYVSSSSGSIRLALREEAAFDLDARTNSGRIDSRHPVTVVGAIDRRSIAGKVRGGGPLLRLRASSGSIRIE